MTMFDRPRRLAFACVLLALSCGGCGWAQFHAGPEHAGVNPFAFGVSTSNIANFVERWSHATGGAVESSPAVLNGVVYVGSDDGRLYALDARTGVQRWAFVAGGPVRSSPAVVNGVVYFGSDDHVLYALDARTGAKRWSVTLGAGFGGITAIPTVVGGTVYVVRSSPSTAPALLAFDATTGGPRWNTPIADAGGALSPAAVRSNSTVYVGDYSGRALYAFDATTGVRRWRVEAPPGGSFPASCVFQGLQTPVVAGGRVLFSVCAETHGDWNAALVSFDATTGAVQWSTAPIRAISFSSVPAVTGNRVFAAAVRLIPEPGFFLIEGGLGAYDLTTGAPVWGIDRPNAEFASPAFANGVIVQGEGLACRGDASCPGTDVVAFDATTGAQLWSAETGGAVSSSPAIADGAIVAGSSDGKVYAYAPVEGK